MSAAFDYAEHKARRARLGYISKPAAVPVERVRRVIREKPKEVVTWIEPEAPPVEVAPPTPEELLEKVRTQYQTRRLPNRLRITDVEHAVITVFGVTGAQLCGPGRDRKTFLARAALFWICRRLIPVSLSQLGRVYDRDHTTVYHAISTFPDRMSVDPALDEAVQMIITALGGE